MTASRTYGGSGPGSVLIVFIILRRGWLPEFQQFDRLASAYYCSVKHYTALIYRFSGGSESRDMEKLINRSKIGVATLVTEPLLYC